MRKAERILEGLNERQREAVTTVDGPLLVVAGPGSGKTRVLVARIAWLLAAGHARMQEILAMTFTNKAAGEMLERAEKLLNRAGYQAQFQAGKGRLWMGTFHSMFARIIRIHAERIGFTSDFSIYDQQDSQQVVKRLLAEESNKNVKPRPVHGFISWAKNRMLTEDQIDPQSPVQEMAVKLMRPYDEALRKANAMDFDDLLLKTYQLLRRNEDVLDDCQRRWTHVMIDEFQDTNTLQYRLAQMIAQRHRNICAVGDDCQSIYAFRGAEIRNILLFNRDFPDTKIIRLEQNYRSTKNILKLADSVIKHNVGRIDKTLWTSNNDGGKIDLFSAHSGETEADKVVREIQNFMIRHQYRRKDFAVLYRTNRLSRPFEDALRTSGIPYRVYGSLSFYQRKEVKNACAYLRLMVNPNDVASFLRVVNYPRRGIGAVSQKAILAVARRSEEGLPYALAHLNEIGLRSGKARRELHKFRELLSLHATRLTEEKDIMPVIESLLRQSGLWEEIRSDDTIMVESRIENLQELLGAIKQHVSEDDGTLSSFLQQVELVTSEDESDAPLDSVTLMTAHASKGLEFEVVFLCGLEEGLFPVNFGDDNAASQRQQPDKGPAAATQVAVGDVDFENKEIRTMLDTIAILADPNHTAALSRNKALGSVAARYRKRLQTDNAWTVIEAALDALDLNQSPDVRNLRRILAKEAAASTTAEEILRLADAVRLRREINRITASVANQGAMAADACEEERRLFYVAVTRAKSRLFLSWARRRFYAGEVRWGEPSRFLSELDNSLLNLPARKKQVKPNMPTHFARFGRSNNKAANTRKGRPVRNRSVSSQVRRASDFGKIQQGRKTAIESVVAGDRVRHKMFGEGIVRSTSKTGYGKQAVVYFDRVGEKKLILQHAHLEKLS